MKRKFSLILMMACMTAVVVSAQTAEKANRLFENEKYAEALAQYEVLRKRNPKNLLYTYRTARCLQEVGRYRDALPLFAKTGKKYVLTYFFAAECYQALWMSEEAITNYQLYSDNATNKDRDAYIQAQIAVAEKRMRYLKRVTDIQIIDSVIVGKQDLLRAYPLSHESGQLAPTDQGGITYTNSRGDRRYFTHQEGKTTLLQQQNRLLQQWETAETLPETVNRADRQGYPFCLSDGITFYFASQSEDGMGGWDIYMTRYNSTTNTFAAAENIGYPFNSEANDYLYVADEQAGIGYFATDRRCSADSVCVYTFLLEEPSRYLSSTMPHDSLVAYALLQTYHRAARPERNLQTSETPAPVMQTMRFVISNEVVYTSMSDFRSDEAKRAYLQYEEWLKEHAALNNELDELRQTYTEADEAQRKKLTATILSVENRRNELQRQIDMAAQKIRQLEQS